jgi:hypothetical protein
MTRCHSLLFLYCPWLSRLHFSATLFLALHWIQNDMGGPRVRGGQSAAGDYGYTVSSDSLQRAGPLRTEGSILLNEIRPVAFQKNGTTYPLNPSGPASYDVTVNGTNYTLRMYFYCTGKSATAMPANAQSLACPLKPSLVHVLGGVRAQ